MFDERKEWGPSVYTVHSRRVHMVLVIVRLHLLGWMILDQGDGRAYLSSRVTDLLEEMPRNRCPVGGVICPGAEGRAGHRSF